MYVRKVGAKKATFFQIGQKIKGKFVLIKHVGSASTLEQIKLLQFKALEELKQMKLDRQPSLFPDLNGRVDELAL